MAVRDLQIDIPDENAFVEYVETNKDGEHNDNIHVEAPLDTDNRTASKDTTTSTPEETDTENSSTEIVAFADVDASVVEDTKIYDEPPKEIPKTVKLPVRKRIEFKILILVYKCLHGTAPSYLMELLKEYVPPWALRSTSKNLLCEPRNNMKTYSDRSFSACVPQLWIQLPDNIWAAGSVAIFKRQLKNICSKMYISIDYVDLNIYPLRMRP